MAVHTTSEEFAMPEVIEQLKPKLSDFLLDLRRSLAHKGFAKILDISTGYACGFCKSLCIKISAHIFAKNRST